MSETLRLQFDNPLAVCQAPPLRRTLTLARPDPPTSDAVPDTLRAAAATTALFAGEVMTADGAARSATVIVAALLVTAPLLAVMLAAPSETPRAAPAESTLTAP